MLKILFTCALILSSLPAPVMAQELAPTSPTAPAPVSVDAVVPAPAMPPQEGAPVAGAAPASAQTSVANLPAKPDDFIPSTQEITPIERAMLDQIDFLKPPVDIATMPSLFFSVWEHDLLVDARRGLNTRPANDDDQVEATVAEGPRDISLAGIVYTSSKDWVIWLNNMRISPGRIPNEIMDIKVYKSHIDMEWFDASTNQIFPIRLRPHQRFNLDARMFLPGNI